MPRPRLAQVALLAPFLLALFPACDGVSDSSGTGDGTEPRCTLVACAHVVAANFVEFTDRFGGDLPASISLCFDTRPCRQATLELDEGEVRCASSASQADELTCTFGDGRLTVAMALWEEDAITGGAHALSVKLVGKGGEELLNQVVIPTFSEHRPNGPLCEPVCYSSTSAL